MQIELRLVNDFYDIRHKSVKSKTSCSLRPEHAEIVYKALESIMNKLTSKELESWKKERQPSKDPFYSFMKDETKDDFGQIDMDDLWEEYLIGD